MKLRTFYVWWVQIVSMSDEKDVQGKHYYLQKHKGFISPKQVM